MSPDIARLLAIEAAAVALVAKADEHERRRYGHIKVGCFAALRAAVNAVPAPAESHDADCSLLWTQDRDCDCSLARPTTAQRLDAL